MVTLHKDGVTVRHFGRRVTVKVSLTQLVKKGLVNGGYALTDEEYTNPIATLGKLKIPSKPRKTTTVKKFKRSNACQSKLF